MMHFTSGTQSAMTPNPKNGSHHTVSTSQTSGLNTVTRGDTGEGDSGERALSVVKTYTCPEGHVTSVPLWEHAEIPDVWKCRVCSRFAALPGVDGAETGQWRPASLAHWEPKTHLQQLHERRTDAELEALLAERLTLLRSFRADKAA